MSFGATNNTKTAQNNLSGTSNLALNNLFPAVTGAGSDMLAKGAATAQPGINFLSTILGGNNANTAALLKPSTDQIRQQNANLMTAINTLMPRGGARSANLFGQSFAPSTQIANLFNTARTNAATTLPSIGLQQSGLGTNLFGIGSSALGAANNANMGLGQLSQNQQQMTNNLWSSLGQGLFGLATTPFGGGAAKNGLLGLL